MTARYTLSVHFLVSRLVIFILDSQPRSEVERWMWVMLKESTPTEICNLTDPTVLLQYAEHAGHGPTKTECHIQAVKWL